MATLRRRVLAADPATLAVLPKQVVNVNDRGERPTQVRIVPTAGLRDRGGPAAIELADEDLLWHAVRFSGVL